MQSRVEMTVTLTAVWRVCGSVDKLLTTDAPQPMIMSSLVELPVTLAVVTVLAVR